MPLVKKKIPSEKSRGRVLFKKQCKYIGSVAVSLLNGEERLRFVNEKLMEMKDVGKGVRVVLMITDEGAKVLKENESAVKMAHGITRIAFSTCQPERKLFAYVAKSFVQQNVSITQAHMFKTKKDSHSQQLSTHLSKAFKIAYARDSTRRTNRVSLFESEAEEEKVLTEITSRGKRWARQEIAHGHEYSSHAAEAKGKHVSSDIKKLMAQLDLDNGKTSAPQNSVNEASNNVSVSSSSGASERETLDDSIESTDKPPKRKISEGRKIDKGRNVSSGNVGPRTISQEQRSSQDDVINLNGEDMSPRTSSEFNFVSPAARFSSSGSLSGYENVTLTKDGYQVDEVFFEETSSEASESVSELPNDIVDVASGESITETVADQKGGMELKRSRMDVSRFTMTEEELLKDSEWFQPGFSREISETMLLNRSIGSFFIRDSTTHLGCYVMTVRVPEHMKEKGVANFLIEQVDDLFKIKGFSSRFPTLSDLVAHYGSLQEDIPCQLRLAQDNPLFLRRRYIDQPDSGSHNPDPIDEFDDIVDDDYEYDDPDYINFTSNDGIMRELEVLQ